MRIDAAGERPMLLALALVLTVGTAVAEGLLSQAQWIGGADAVGVKPERNLLA